MIFYYNVLIYYPPKINQFWQFEQIVQPYQGLANRFNQGLDLNYYDLILNNSWQIASEPIFFCHTLGSGDDAFIADPRIQFEPIAYHFPRLSNGIPPYNLKGPVFFKGENDQGQQVSFRQLMGLFSSFGSFPYQGMELEFTPDSNGYQKFSLEGQISDRDTKKVVGFLTPNHGLNQQYYYQYCVSFLVKIQQLNLLFVGTTNLNQQGEILLNSKNQTAFDLFFF